MLGDEGKGYLISSTDVYAKPDGSEVIGHIEASFQVEGILQGDWLKISYKGIDGYIKNKLISSEKPRIDGWLSYSIVVRDSKGGSIIGRLPAGFHVEKGIDRGDWVEISYEGKTAYISKYFVCDKEEIPWIDGWLSYSIVVRESKGGSIIGRLPVNHYVKSGIDRGDWVEISYKGKTDRKSVV